MGWRGRGEQGGWTQRGEGAARARQPRPRPPLSPGLADPGEWPLCGGHTEGLRRAGDGRGVGTEEVEGERAREAEPGAGKAGLGPQTAGGGAPALVP